MSELRLRGFSKTDLLDILVNQSERVKELEEKLDAANQKLGTQEIAAAAQPAIVTPDSTMEKVYTEQKKASYKKKYFKTLRSTIAVLMVVASISVLLTTLLFPVVQVSGQSMEPTLQDGDMLMLLKSPNYSRGELACVNWQNKYLLKRVIGLPGDTITIDLDGNVYVNNELIDEPYVSSKSYGECDLEFPIQVPDGKLFVLGDHRDTSIDSRSSTVGYIDNDQVLGRVLFRFWPSNQIEWLN